MLWCIAFCYGRLHCVTLTCIMVCWFILCCINLYYVEWFILCCVMLHYLALCCCCIVLQCCNKNKEMKTKSKIFPLHMSDHPDSTNLCDNVFFLSSYNNEVSWARRSRCVSALLLDCEFSCQACKVEGEYMEASGHLSNCVI